MRKESLNRPTLFTFLFALPLFSLAACGVSQKEPPKDDPLARTMDVAKEAVFYSKLQQAEVDYKKSCQYALTRDDVQDIDNAGYNLAVVQLDLDKIQPALQTVHETRNELWIRNQQNSEQLDLVEAAILYRLKRLDEAARLLQNSVQSVHEDIQERAYFFLGLIAEAQQNTSLLSEYSQKLDQLLVKEKKKAEESWKADQGELKALLDYRLGHFEAASVTARQVETIRRQQIEYRAMIRALVLQAKIAEATGNRLLAAQFYVRAGKSAALLKAYPDASQYLNRVLVLHADPITYDLAARELTTLAKMRDKSKGS